MSKDALTPAIGYVSKTESDTLTKSKGVKGLERYYEDYLAPIQNAKILGPRDIGNNIILTSDSNLATRVDGYNAVLSICLLYTSRCV